METNLEEIDILNLIPQRPPFVMVDCLCSFADRQATTRFRITADNILVEDNRLTPAGMMENIAQSCAAMTGYMAVSNGMEVKIGVIGAVRNMAINRQPKVGEEVQTTITVRDEVFGMTMVDAEMRMGDEVLATTEMKIALIDKQA